MPTTLLRDLSVLVPTARSALAAQALFKRCSTQSPWPFGTPGAGLQSTVQVTIGADWPCRSGKVSARRFHIRPAHVRRSDRGLGLVWGRCNGSLTSRRGRFSRPPADRRIAPEGNLTDHRGREARLSTGSRLCQRTSRRWCRCGVTVEVLVPPQNSGPVSVSPGSARNTQKNASAAPASATSVDRQAG
jgi:hypothetical protein